MEPACASQAAKGEAACDAQTAKGKPRKQITSGFSELLQIMQCLARCTIKFYLPNIKITTR
jgi:hypothetical protein